jgi:hypothetical protein
MLIASSGSHREHQFSPAHRIQAHKLVEKKKMEKLSIGEEII